MTNSDLNIRRVLVAGFRIIGACFNKRPAEVLSKADHRANILSTPPRVPISDEVFSVLSGGGRFALRENFDEGAFTRDDYSSLLSGGGVRRTRAIRL
jgi:hypothetical protein